MPTLEWMGKAKVIAHHQDVPYRVLEHVYDYGTNSESRKDNRSGNMIIHGDNLEALKSLLPKFEGKVDVVYIDPPYNTGNEGWVYNDNVNDPRILKWIGEVVGKEGEDFTRHDKWLCMMYPRLKLLQKLLSPNGVIFISIDDNELYNLKEICDEIFGASCFVANISWQRTYSTRNDSKGIVSEVEHILVYGKSPDWQPNKLARTAEMDAIYKNPDNDIEPWTSDNPNAPGASTHQGMVYAIQHAFTGELLYPSNGSCWRYQQDTMLDIMNGWCEYELRDIHDENERALICGVPVGDVRKDVKAIMLKESLEHSRARAQEVLDRGQWPKFYYTRNGQGGLRRKTYLSAVGGVPPTNLWEYSQAGHTDAAAKELKAIFEGRSTFDTPKPSKLIELVLRIAGNRDATVLDSFAGSGTTAHAVLNLNKEDGGNRKFILVEVMDYAEEITAERAKRVIDGFAEEHEETIELFDEKITTASLKKGKELYDKAKAAKDEAAEKYTKVSNPKIVEVPVGKKTEAHLQVIATLIHEENVSGTGGSFGFYELGDPLFVDGYLNPSVAIDHIREYIWYTETNSNYSREQTDNTYLLGTEAGVAYYFCYEPDRAVALNSEILRSIQEKADRYIIYADTCELSQAALDKYNMVFKKIPRDITHF